MEGAKILELVMFWIFEKRTPIITFNPVGLAMPIPGFLDKSCYRARRQKRCADSVPASEAFVIVPKPGSSIDHDIHVHR